MTCIIVDDEPLAQEILEEYVKKVPQLELLATLESGLEAIQFVQEQLVDLVFLDIQMPDISGIQTAGLLGNKTNVIFTTAYNEYAVEGFELEAVDYLLKPISFDRFLKAVQRLQQPEEGVQPKTTAEDYIFVKAEYKIKKIRFDDILYIEGMKDYLRIVTDNEKVMTLLSFTKLMPKLPSSRFLRIHKSYVVSLNAIDSIEKGKLKLGDTYLPVSESYKPALDEYVKSRMA